MVIIYQVWAAGEEEEEEEEEGRDGH